MRVADHEHEYLRALERAVCLGVVVLARGTLADGTPFVITSTASRPSATHTVLAYLDLLPVIVRPNMASACTRLSRRPRAPYSPR